MNLARMGIFIGIISLVALTVSLESSFAQDQPVPKIEVLQESEVQWIWAEVVSVDVQKRELLVKYLDYETDMEKEIVITVDDKTGYENVPSLTEIKKGDNLSIDYVIDSQNRNIARNISVEILENILMPQEDTTPEATKATPNS